MHRGFCCLPVCLPPSQHLPFFIKPSSNWFLATWAVISKPANPVALPRRTPFFFQPPHSGTRLVPYVPTNTDVRYGIPDKQKYNRPQILNHIPGDGYPENQSRERPSRINQLHTLCTPPFPALPFVSVASHPATCNRSHRHRHRHSHQPTSPLRTSTSLEGYTLAVAPWIPSSLCIPTAYFSTIRL